MHTWMTYAGRTLLALMLLALLAPLPERPARAQSGDDDTLVVATMWEALPHSMQARRSRFFNESEVLDTLVKMDFQGGLRPGLATEWERVSEERWVFTFREGVVFHDGSPLNAQAVKHSLERIVALLPYAEGLLDLRAVEVVAPHKVAIETNAPFAGLPNQLTDAFTGVYAASSFDEDGEFLRPVGTGPYKLVSYDKQDRTVVETFADYWGPQPEIKRVVYRYIPDHNSRVLAMEAGEVDLAVNIPPADVRRLRGHDDFKVYEEPAAGLYYMALNTAQGPFSDVRVRRAVNLLLDRALLVEGALDGIGRPAPEFFAPQFDWVPSPQPRYEHDPERARVLLREAGYTKEDGRWQRDGEPLTLRLLSYSTRTEMVPITEVTAALLRSQGIESDISLYTWPGMMDLVKQGKYDGYVVYWTPEMTGHPDLHLMTHFHSAHGMDHNGYRDPELDRLLEKGRAMAPGPEMRATYRRALEIVHRDAPIAPLVHKVYVAASTDELEGFRVHPSGFFYNFKEVRLD